jgi:hypothetical protein
VFEYEALSFLWSRAPTASTFGWFAGNSTVPLPEFPAAATTTTPAETARSIAFFTVWLKPSLPRLRLMTLTGFPPPSPYSIA